MESDQHTLRQDLLFHGVIKILEADMPRLLAVWKDTENSREILEDVCNTLAHTVGYEPPQLRELWARIESTTLS